MICLVPDCTSLAAAENNVCEDCWTTRQCLHAQIPPLWFGLHNLLEPGSVRLQEAVQSRKAKSRPPLQICVLDALHSVPELVHGWANTCLASRDLPLMQAEGKRWGVLLTQSLAILGAHDEMMRLHYQARLYLRDLRMATRRMTMLAGLDPAVTRIKGPCPDCGNTALPLLRDTTSERVVCPACRTGWTEPQWTALILERLRG